MKGIKRFFGILLLLAGIAVGFFMVYSREWQPTPAGNERYVRFAQGTPLTLVLAELETQGIVKNASAARWYARYKKAPALIDPGTYQLKPGMTLDQVFAALQDPVRQMVRLPEGWWIARTAPILEKNGVCSAEEYIAAANNGAKFKEEFDFPVPDGSLEGYLFPDTYDLPPQMGAEAVIRRQLQAFEAKVWPELKGNPDPNAILTKASMIELEAAKDNERPMVAGVIDNRLKRGMRLELDATVLYALQEWKVLGPGQVRKVVSPYNTYLNAGLPPGPIGSPGLASVQGALNPDTHGYLFYVARPDRTHYFSTTYAEHMANIRRARAEFREAE